MHIDELDWDDKNTEHVEGGEEAVTREEVEEAVVDNEPQVRTGRDGTYEAYGQTNGGRYLLTILSPRKNGKFYVVTSRPMKPSEKKKYKAKGK